MANLTLSDGTVFTGESFGAEADTDGEVVFNTGMVGYPESLTDPSYRGQILVFTYPLIGNYGVPANTKNQWGFSDVLESDAVQVRGVVCTQVSDHYSHAQAKQSLSDWLTENNIPGITGVDTRALTKKLREQGVMLGSLRQDGNGGTNVDDPNLRNLVAEVSVEEPITYEPTAAANAKKIIAFDCGMKHNIPRSFLSRGITVHRVPWNYDLSQTDLDYDGVFISNGPGDPKLCTATIEQIRWAINKDIPTFGICLGNQLLSLAIGGDTYKLKYGHRGANQPCLQEGSDHRCIITSQNHGFAVDGDSLPNDWNVWWRNANDQSVEGIRHKSGRFFSVQFHPEAAPGPEDAGYLFDEFIELL